MVKCLTPDPGDEECAVCAENNIFSSVFTQNEQHDFCWPSNLFYLGTKCKYKILSSKTILTSYNMTH